MALSKNATVALITAGLAATFTSIVAIETAGDQDVKLEASKQAPVAYEDKTVDGEYHCADKLGNHAASIKKDFGGVKIQFVKNGVKQPEWHTRASFDQVQAYARDFCAG